MTPIRQLGMATTVTVACFRCSGGANRAFRHIRRHILVMRARHCVWTQGHPNGRRGSGRNITGWSPPLHWTGGGGGWGQCLWAGGGGGTPL